MLSQEDATLILPQNQSVKIRRLLNGIMGIPEVFLDELGIVPVSAFANKLRSVTSVSSPNSVGIVPM